MNNETPTGSTEKREWVTPTVAELAVSTGTQAGLGGFPGAEDQIYS